MKTLVSWSSGKDSAWMVHTLRQRGDVEIGALLTTINEPAQRVAMHAVRVEVLQAQADGARVSALDGADSVAVPERGLRGGDARGGRARRARRLHPRGVRRPVSRGHPEVPRGAAGRQRADADVSAVRHRRRHAAPGARDDRRRPARADHLPEPEGDGSRDSPAASSTRRCSTSCPPSIDPCAERGEFHTCAYAGPMFNHPVAVETGITVERDGYVFTDFTHLQSITR